MAKYVQYINACFGAFPCTKEVKSYNIEEVLDEVISLNNKEIGIQIVGFRFFEKEKEQIVEQTGVHYLEGECIKNASKDVEIVEYFTQKRHAVPDFPVIKISNPFLLVYPLYEKDKIIEKSIIKKAKERMTRKKEILIVRKEIEECKKNIVQELYRIADAVESEQFEKIPFIQNKEFDKKVYLDLFAEEGGIKEYIDYLKKRLDEIKKLQEPIFQSEITKE
ncbi:MAG: hypothetical protein II992_01435 [Lachnospiraceae bacterium]|nr:hypothetical protein [Lachnospiraceae bacterium]